MSLRARALHLTSPECLCCPWENIDSQGLTTTPFQLAPLVFRVCHAPNFGLDPNGQMSNCRTIPRIHEQPIFLECRRIELLGDFVFSLLFRDKPCVVLRLIDLLSESF